MKYYLYISATKVDMLHAQLPPKLLHDASASLKLDLGRVEAEFKVGAVTAEQRLYQRLAVVVKALEKSGEPIGDLDAPTKWVRATGSFQWFMRTDVARQYPLLFADGFYFVGSPQHVIGSSAPAQNANPNATFVSPPTDAFEVFSQLANEAREASARVQDESSVYIGGSAPLVQHNPPMALELMAIVYARTPRSFARGIGSPLYVAMA